MAIRRLNQQHRTVHLDNAANNYISQGYRLVHRGITTALLVRKRRWNWIIFIFGGLLTIGLLWLIYPLYYLLRKEERLELHVDDLGNVQARKK